MQVVLMAGGKGERLAAVSGGLPKPLVRLHERPILAWTLEGLIRRGAQHICVCVGPNAAPFERELVHELSREVRIDFVTEEQPLGTIGALLQCPLQADQPCVVMNGDVITTFDPRLLLQQLEQESSDWCIAAHEASFITRFGEVRANSEGVLAEYREKPRVSHQFSSGIYAISAKVRQHLAESKQLAAEPLPEMLKHLLQQGFQVDLLPHEELWIDINDQDDLAIAERELSKQHLQAIVGLGAAPKREAQPRFGERGWAF